MPAGVGGTEVAATVPIPIFAPRFVTGADQQARASPAAAP
jgi:hypothetical protein